MTPHYSRTNLWMTKPYIGKGADDEGDQGAARIYHEEG